MNINGGGQLVCSRKNFMRFYSVWTTVSTQKMNKSLSMLAVGCSELLRTYVSQFCVLDFVKYAFLCSIDLKISKKNFSVNTKAREVI